VKKFGNTANKIKAILRVIQENDGASGREIVKKLAEEGYRVKEGNINMFIYYNMLYKYVTKKRINGINRYFTLQ
jgi:arginine repressor